MTDDGFDDERDTDGAAGSTDRNSAEAHSGSGSDIIGGFQFGVTKDTESGAEADESPTPYLTSLPEAYVADLLVMEWMKFLVENSDVTDAARAIRYYERIDWVTSDVAQTLQEYLVGFGNVNFVEIERSTTTGLSLSHHAHSLKYVRALSGSVASDRHLRPKPFDPDDEGR